MPSTLSSKSERCRSDKGCSGRAPRLRGMTYALTMTRPRKGGPAFSFVDVWTVSCSHPNQKQELFPHRFPFHYLYRSPRIKTTCLRDPVSSRPAGGRRPTSRQSSPAAGAETAKADKARCLTRAVFIYIASDVGSANLPDICWSWGRGVSPGSTAHILNCDSLLRADGHDGEVVLTSIAGPAVGFLCALSHVSASVWPFSVLCKRCASDVSNRKLTFVSRTSLGARSLHRIDPTGYICQHLMREFTRQRDPMFQHMIG